VTDGAPVEVGVAVVVERVRGTTLWVHPIA